MGRKWVIVLTCVIYIAAGVWSLPLNDGQPVSSGIPANISSPETPETKAGVSKPSSDETPPAQEAKDSATTANVTVKTVAGAENKTLESEANMTDASNVTEAKVDPNESDASKDSQSIATVVHDSKGNESEKAVSDSNNPKSETQDSSDPETLKPPESRKATVGSPTDISQKPEAKELETNQSSLLDVGTKAPPVSPVPGVQKGSTAAAVAEKPGGSDVVVSEENKNAEVKKDSPVTSAQDREVSQVPKVKSPIDSPSKDESTTKPSSSFQPSVKLDVSKPSNEDLPKGSSDDTISFGSEVNGDGSSIADGATYGDSYASEEEDYEEESKSRVESQRDGSLIKGGTFTDDADSHFFAYFLTIMVTAIIFYLVFHNKQRIIALIIEGRAPRNGRTRRASSRAKYHKLDNNLEEAITATKGTNGC